MSRLVNVLTGVVGLFGLAGCVAIKQYALVPADENKFILTGGEGHKFIFFVRRAHLHAASCDAGTSEIRALVEGELQKGGYCSNGFVAGTINYSPPECRVLIQCK
jgi:hypothetical protein